ncbi:MAG TPA: outer membrane protein assembly factor BamB [Rhodanobacteraceae bacterium]|nr:outer membrane protein assembly factor BamB [Rhodanobacteraceae bacterium]
MKRSSILILAALGIALGGCNWLKSLGKKDNVEPPTPLTEFTPTVQVERLWGEGVGDGAGDSGAHLAPMVVDGKLYAASVDGTIEAIDAASGRTIWEKRLGERHGWLWKRGDNSLRWAGGPAVAGDLLVVGSLDGDVFALSAADGSERWHGTVSSEVVSRPAISDAVVVVRTIDGRLTGLDPKDGTRKWVFDQSVPPLSLRGNSAPIIVGDAVYDGFDNGKIVSVRLADGAPLWAQTLSTGEGRTEVERLADVDGDLVPIGGNIVAVGYRGQVAAIAADSGRPMWQRDVSSYGGAAAGDTTLVLADADGNVWAFDRDTGASLWKQDQLKYRWLGTPAIQGKYVVIGDSEGFVHWLSLDEGKFAARERLGKKAIESAPIVVGDTVYVEDVKGNIGAYAVR